jgi:tyramine---L-glutamate ligase
MRRILVYESLSGGGEPELGDDAASLLSQGLAMRDAVVADLLRIDTLQVSRATCTLPGAAQRLAHARLVDVSPRQGESAVAFVQRLAAGHDLVWAVAPETDGVLLALHEAVGATRWVGCEAQAIRTASSKQATLAALAARGVATPLAFADGADAATRWIVKPDDGAGGIDTRVHTRRDDAFADLAARRAQGRSATAEPFVEGEALSVSLLAGPGFVQPLALNRQRIAIGADGRVDFQGVQINALDRQHDTRAIALHLAALDVARALPGLRGFVGIDVVWHATRGPVVIEVNPRTTCAYVGLSAALGRNLAEEVLMLQQLPAAAASPTDAHR